VPSPTSPLPPPKRHTTEAFRPRPIAFAAAGVLLAAGLAGWYALRPRALPVIGAVPPFALRERSGEALGAGDLAGHVWVANFVFTRCPDVCPMLTTRMGGLQETLTRGEDPIRLVSFSVDPDRDTPEVLRAYATRAGAGRAWLFVTGPRAAIAALLREGFRVAYADDGPPTAPITHSDRFVLVDRQLRIRGYYHGLEPADIERLARDATALRDGRVS
jgi:protein SCO1/2